jgi:hypothetical protein
MPEIPPELVDFASAAGGVNTVLLLLVGFLLAFFGKNFFKAIWFLIGGLMLMAVGLVLGIVVGPRIGQPTLCPVIGAVVGFLVGGYMGISWARRLMCLIAAGIGYTIGSAVGSFISPENALVIGIVLAIIFFLIVYIKFDDVLSVMTAIMGGATIGYVASSAMGGNPIVFLVVTIGVAIAGMYVQLKIGERYPDHSYKDERAG